MKGREFEDIFHDFLDNFIPECELNLITNMNMKPGVQGGKDFYVELARNDEQFTFYFEAKNYDKPLDSDKILARLLQIQSQNPDIFIVVSPKQELPNQVQIIFEELKDNVQYLIKQWTPSEKVEELFSLYPEIYKEVYHAEAPQSLIDRRSDIFDHWKAIITLYCDSIKKRKSLKDSHGKEKETKIEEISRDDERKVENLKEEICEFNNSIIEWIDLDIKEEFSVDIFNYDLVQKIFNYYNESKLRFRDFCDRKKELKETFNRLTKTVEITGIGGIGKTTLCELILIFCRLIGKQVYYLGMEESYASGTGYAPSSRIIPSNRENVLTFDDIGKSLNLQNFTNFDEIEKIDKIIQDLDSGTGKILFIDDFKSTEPIENLLRTANSRLNRGVIILTAKNQVGLCLNRINLDSIKEDEQNLVKIFVSRLGLEKTLNDEDIRAISDLAEGHPIAVYLLVAASPFVTLEALDSMKKEISRSNPSDFTEYMRRVIELSLSDDAAFNILKEISLIDSILDRELLEQAINLKHQDIDGNSLINRYIRSFLLSFHQGELKWGLDQLRLFLSEDIPEMHLLAIEYFKLLESRSNLLTDRAHSLYHLVKSGDYSNSYSQTMELLENLKGVHYVDDAYFKLLTTLLDYSSELEKQGEMNKALALLFTINAQFSDNLENCDSGERYAQEALKIFNEQAYPLKYSQLMLYFGNIYRNRADYSDRLENCEKSFKYLELAYNGFTALSSQKYLADTLKSMSNIYQILSEIDNVKENLVNSLMKATEALQIYVQLNDIVDMALTEGDIGDSYQRLANYNIDPNTNFKLSLEHYSKGFNLITKDEYPLIYAHLKRGIGETYYSVAKFENRLEDLQKAIQSYEEAIVLYGEAGAISKIFNTKINLAISYFGSFEMNKEEKDIKLLNSAMNLLIEFLPSISGNDRQTRKYVLMSLGMIFLEKSRIDRTEDVLLKGKQYLEDALVVADSLNDLKSKGYIYENLANYYQILMDIKQDSISPEERINNLLESIKIRQDALGIYIKIGLPLRIPVLHYVIGKNYHILCDLQQTRFNCEQAIHHFEEFLCLADNWPVPFITKQEVFDARISLALVFNFYACIANDLNYFCPARLCLLEAMIHDPNQEERDKIEVCINIIEETKSSVEYRNMGTNYTS